MPVTLCVLLWAVPGNENTLIEYEDLVLARLDAYGARVLRRVRNVQSSTSPFEVQLIELPTEDALAQFMEDPDRLALSDLRAQGVARTEVITVSNVAASGEPWGHVDQIPVLTGGRVTLRPGTAAEVAGLCAVLAEPSVARWWGDGEAPEEIAAKLRGESYAVLLVIQVDGELAGGIEYHEENEPGYRHAGIDIYVAHRWQGQGVGAEAIGLLARYLIDERGHHRLTIDPAVSNVAAIACYEKVGFRRVGVMREYERGADDTFHDGLLMDLVARDLAPAESWMRAGQSQPDVENGAAAPTPLGASSGDARHRPFGSSPDPGY
jgi:aminoglycoside 6'-N-acetyltransferase